MAASKNSKPAASEDAVEITSIPQDDIDQIIAANEPKREELAGGTIRETSTVYEDRTLNPQADRDVEYEVTEEEMPHGTILTSYGSPIGGFPEESE